MTRTTESRPLARLGIAAAVLVFAAARASGQDVAPAVASVAGPADPAPEGPAPGADKRLDAHFQFTS
ncbi:MAG TPA: hypothetical protein VFA98_14615, partial [Thermoanaerobaculia bacterium]|nr:hypothetical protein [Thermoanaerobaculia bacterium]